MRPERLLIASVLGACASGRFVEFAGYDQSCAADSDCVVKKFGDLCGCGCDYQAINITEISRYNTESAGTCPKADFDCSGCPGEPTAVCRSGMCGLAGYGYEDLTATGTETETDTDTDTDTDTGTASSGP